LKVSYKSTLIARSIGEVLEALQDATQEVACITALPEKVESIRRQTAGDTEARQRPSLR